MVKGIGLGLNLYQIYNSLLNMLLLLRFCAGASKYRALFIIRVNKRTCKLSSLFRSLALAWLLNFSGVNADVFALAHNLTGLRARVLLVTEGAAAAFVSQALVALPTLLVRTLTLL